MVKLFSKNSNLCDHNSPTLQTDRQTDRQTVEDRIMKFSPHGSPIPLILRGKFHPEILRVPPSGGVKQLNKGGVGKISSFLSLSVHISKTVLDTAKVTINDYRKSHMGFPLTPRSMTLDDLG